MAHLAQSWGGGGTVQAYRHSLRSLAPGASTVKRSSCKFMKYCGYTAGPACRCRLSWHTASHSRVWPGRSAACAVLPAFNSRHRRSHREGVGEAVGRRNALAEEGQQAGAQGHTSGGAPLLQRSREAAAISETAAACCRSYPGLLYAAKRLGKICKLAASSSGSCNADHAR